MVPFFAEAEACLTGDAGLTALAGGSLTAAADAVAGFLAAAALAVGGFTGLEASAAGAGSAA